ncbi:MAG: hypothetical protein ACRDV0_02975, partial [Acidimicrobiales bacterium]
AGLRGQVASQLTLSSNLLRTLTGRYTDAPVVISGHPTSAGLAALGRAGARDAVIAETALATPPSTTLTWGAPFHVAGAPGVLALATDQGLDDLAANSSIAPGLRAVLTLDTLAFLHYEEPNAPAVRTEVLVVPAAQVDPTYVNDLLSGLTHDAFVTPESLTPSFNSTLVGSNGAAATQALGPATPSTWSSLNTFTLRRLAAMLTSYAAAIPHSPEADALRVALARAEVVGAPGPRQAGLERVSATLDAQLSLFSVDAGAITLTGPDTALPLTLYSHAGYAVNAVVHLVTDRMTFPGGADQPVSLDAPVKSLRVATAHHRGSSLILQVIVTTPNGRVTLARAAVPVRIAGASVVGYLLTGASLLVLALWWYRTHRSRSRGRHAR